MLQVVDGFEVVRKINALSQGKPDNMAGPEEEVREASSIAGLEGGAMMGPATHLCQHPSKASLTRSQEHKTSGPSAYPSRAPTPRILLDPLLTG